MRIFISIKKPLVHIKVTELLKEFFLCLAETFGAYPCTTMKKHKSFDTFFRNNERYGVSERSLSFSNDHNIVFMYDISCPLKGCLLDDRNVRKPFSALNLIKICVQSFTCNNISPSVSLLNENLYLHKKFSFKHTKTNFI